MDRASNPFRRLSRKHLIFGAVALLLVAAFVLVASTHQRPAVKKAEGSTPDQPAAARPAVVTKLGVHENYQGPGATTLERTLRAFPRIDVTREFESGPLRAQSLIKHFVAHCGPMWAKGMTAVWSFKPTPADVRSGAWKPSILALAHYISAHHLESKTVIVIWHEPENDVPAFFKSAADFVSLFNTVNAWLLGVDPAIVTSHAALGYRYHTMTSEQARQWVTTATIQSIDLYSGRSTALSSTLGSSDAFTRWKASRPAGSRWGVSERGWIATASLSRDRVAAINAEGAWLASLKPADRPAFYIVWNTPGRENNPKLPLDAAGVAAVNRLFARLALGR